MLKTFVLATALSLALAACGTGGGLTGPAGAVTDSTYGFNPQQFINVNQGWADLNMDGKPDFIFSGGKRGDKIDVTVEFAEDGKLKAVHYSADSLDAIDPDQLRADVEKTVAEANGVAVENLGDDLTSLVDSLVKTLLTSGVL